MGAPARQCHVLEVAMRFRIRRSIEVSRHWIARAILALVPATCMAQIVTPPQSTFFSTAAVEAYSTYQLPGDGDLWPSCWADDDNLYTANGDGKAFTNATSRYDMAVSVIKGLPPSLSGTTIATDVGTNWSGPSYNRKPTGMLCIHGALYLAFQNLNLNFNDAPAASIAKSMDHGLTWTWDKTAPMFGAPSDPTGPLAHKFTTLFFLDYGKDSVNAIDGYVYAYGLDDNWRDQQAMYLSRVPSKSLQDRTAWEFYAGTDSGGNPTWTPDVTKKTAVLTDQRVLYQQMFRTDCPVDQPVIGQGGVVYDAPLNRYIFSSWSCSTQEFYEAPHPWGPWSRFLSNDFGPLKQPGNYGQYGTNIPSKYISADGKTLYLQSNVWVNAYTFALRKLFVQPYAASTANNALSSTNLASMAGTRAISKSTHFGSLCGLNCSDQLSSGSGSGSEDDFDEESKTTDWWGYTWPQTYNINQVVYETGTMFPDGGWFASNLRVQVRQNFQWIDVPGVTVSPFYPYSSQAGNQTTYTFSFPGIAGDGVRLIGAPGGTSYFTSIGQLGVYFSSSPPVAGSPGFSLSTSATSMTMARGQSGTVTLSVTPTNGFSGQVSFACSGLPGESSCSFTPATVNPSGTAASTATLRISTTATTAHGGIGPWPFAGGGILFALLLFFPQTRRGSYTASVGILCVAGAIAAGCSSGTGSSSALRDPGTPAGDTMVTVTATSGSGASAISHAATISLTVQ